MNTVSEWVFGFLTVKPNVHSRKWILEIESTSGEDTVKIVDTITKNLGYYKNLTKKAAAEFLTVSSHFERTIMNV